MWSPGRFDEQQPITFSQVSLPSSPAVPSVAAGHGDGVALEAVLPPPSPERCNKKESVSAQVTVSSVAARSVEDEVLTTLSTLRNTSEQARQTAMEQLMPLVDEDIRWRVSVIGREFKRALAQIFRIEHAIKQRDDKVKDDAQHGRLKDGEGSEERTRRNRQSSRTTPSSVPTRDGGPPRDSPLPEEHGTADPQAAVRPLGSGGGLCRLQTGVQVPVNCDIGVAGGGRGFLGKNV